MPKFLYYDIIDAWTISKLQMMAPQLKRKRAELAAKVAQQQQVGLVTSLWG